MAAYFSLLFSVCSLTPFFAWELVLGPDSKKDVFATCLLIQSHSVLPLKTYMYVFWHSSTVHRASSAFGILYGMHALCSCQEREWFNVLLVNWAMFDLVVWLRVRGLLLLRMVVVFCSPRVTLLLFGQTLHPSFPCCLTGPARPSPAGRRLSSQGVGDGGSYELVRTGLPALLPDAKSPLSCFDRALHHGDSCSYRQKHSSSSQ